MSISERNDLGRQHVRFFPRNANRQILFHLFSGQVLLVRLGWMYAAGYGILAKGDQLHLTGETEPRFTHQEPTATEVN